MVQLIRSPSQGRDEAAESMQSRNSELDKQALRERIERKRQDDLVRRREFNYLRKMRAQGALGAPGAVARPSVFTNSSGFNPDDLGPQDRARTLKKIDAIEAHMAQNWAESRRQEVVKARPVPPPQPITAAAPAQTPPTVVDAPDADADMDMDLDFTAMLSSPQPAATQPLPLRATVEPVVLPLSSVVPATSEGAGAASADGVHSDFSSSFSNSRLTSVELGEDLENPALQDAAIRYADGDVAGAEAALVSVTQDPDAALEVAEACTAALLDLYRSTGQPASFEVMALEYAQRFGRSAPEWPSASDLLERMTTPAALGPTGDAGAATTGWESPTELTLADVEALRNSQRGAAARRVQWSRLQSVRPDAAEALAGVFTQWASLPLDLHFSGEDVLNALLQAATPVGERSTDPLWWHLRLEALRIEGRQDDFETVALDYCVTYEVSPPSWMEADCTFVRESLWPVLGEMPGVSDTGFSTLDDLQTLPPPLLELRGKVLGEAAEALTALQAQVQAGESLVISCARLERVDFSAAGSMLNWLSARPKGAARVQFILVPRLVAAFFHVMGITEFADVSQARK